MSSTAKMTEAGVILLTRHDVRELLSMEECIEAVEDAFRLLGEGSLQKPGLLGTHVADGGFHVKAGVLPFNDSLFYAAKINANFPANPAKHGLPTIQGAVLLFDADCGALLAIMDSIEITALRTGAATGVAAKHLARQDSAVVTVIGCGVQGRVQLEALCAVLPLRKVYAFDIDPARARAFATDVSEKLKIEAIPVTDFDQATQKSDVVVTCTPSKSSFLLPRHVRAGTFIAAVGADNEEKRELDPLLLVKNRVVVDILQQAVAIGELHHAVEAGLLQRQSPVAELGDVVARKMSGRRSHEEITIFDSTGMALQDVAAACAIYRKARASDQLTRVLLNSEG